MSEVRTCVKKIYTLLFILIISIVGVYAVDSDDEHTSLLARESAAYPDSVIFSSQYLEVDMDSKRAAQSGFVDVRGGSSMGTEDHYVAVRHPNG